MNLYVLTYLNLNMYLNPEVYMCTCTPDTNTRSDDVYMWQEDPTVVDPQCPLQVGLTMYTGFCQEKKMLSGDVAKVCT